MSSIEMSVVTAPVHLKVCQWLFTWQSIRDNWVKALSIKLSSNTLFNGIWEHHASTSMLKHIEFLKHFWVLIAEPLSRTGQCTRTINSAENKTHSGPKPPFIVSDKVTYVGKIVELLTVGPMLSLLCPYSAKLISHHPVRKLRSMSHENPECFDNSISILWGEGCKYLSC